MIKNTGHVWENLQCFPVLMMLYRLQPLLPCLSWKSVLHLIFYKCFITLISYLHIPSAPMAKSPAHFSASMMAWIEDAWRKVLCTNMSMYSEMQLISNICSIQKKWNYISKIWFLWPSDSHLYDSHL